ncbi:hypothetical protein Y032_0332g2787 [Ancylostoma ceylanicum]|uniref:Uncharacterized protein n=1 Tax=Ancylostoma ceylanicum TaxID=53326 RepID=A0A016RZF8_9BILA|nr:hypothetical protein Y032_0332g2787 [Ancylostoma ceylanicum]
MERSGRCHKPVGNPTGRQLLPRLQVPKFTGKRSDWENFWSIFKANIEDQAIPTMLKFNYLNSVDEWTWDKFYEVADHLLNEEELERAKGIFTKDEGMKGTPEIRQTTDPAYTVEGKIISL